jgi:predicted metal-dependent hydrolase
MGISRLLFGQPRRAEKVPQLPVEHAIDGVIYLVHLRPMAQARRMVMRLSRDGASFTMSIPLRQSRKRAEEFIADSEAWMRKALAKAGPTLALVDGAIFPLRGNTVTLKATGKVRGVVQFEAETGVVQVPGAPEHVKRRLLEWLKAEATRDLAAASQRYAEAMQTRFVRLTVRDQKSRWGSCTSDGALSYSWRLIFAPPHVLDYVAAHEVAHLLEMNHGPRFWRLVLRHCKDARSAKQWLKKNGQVVHRYG